MSTIFDPPAGYSVLWADVYTDPGLADPSKSVGVETFEFWSIKGVDLVSPAIRALGPQWQAYLRSHGSDLYGVALSRQVAQNVTLPYTFTLPGQVCLEGVCVPIPGGGFPIPVPGGGTTIAQVEKYRLTAVHSAWPLVIALLAILITLALVIVFWPAISTRVGALLGDFRDFFQGIVSAPGQPYANALIYTTLIASVGSAALYFLYVHESQKEGGGGNIGPPGPVPGGGSVSSSYGVGPISSSSSVTAPSQGAGPPAISRRAAPAQ